ncbi:MAG: hypothetical protein R8J85_10620 [Mariprofundales bacterium]
MADEVLQHNRQQVQSIHDYLLTIRRNMEGIISENHQLRDDVARLSQQLEACQQAEQQMQQREQDYEKRRVQLGQCVDDALDRVEWALAQIVTDDGEGA